MQIDDGFARSVGLYFPIVMITKDILDYNSQFSCKHDWKHLTTTNIVIYMATYEIAQDESKIINPEVKTETRLNYVGFETLTGL